MIKQIKCKKCGKKSILIFGTNTNYCGNSKCPYFELFPKGIEKWELSNESVAHFLTVIDCFAHAGPDDNFDKKSFEKAIQYTLEFIKYRFHPKNIRAKK